MAEVGARVEEEGVLEAVFPGGSYQTRVDRVGVVAAAGVVAAVVDLAVLVVVALVAVEQEEVIKESCISISFRTEVQTS